MTNKNGIFAAILLLLWASACTPSPPDGERVAGQFLQLAVGNDSARRSAAQWLDDHWQPGFAPMAIEATQFLPHMSDIDGLWALLQRKTGMKLPLDRNAWFRWWWAQKLPPGPGYAEFKAALYGTADPHFSGYFQGRGKTARVHLDEIRWGGVLQDGIPPLHTPAMLAAKDATYLDDKDIVYGLEVNDDFRAYPRRILAWHEMFTDKVGGVEVTGVYCTLCESMILYDSTVGGSVRAFGTSGFLLRSNKLMFDHKTQSLWNTLTGQPVVGPLAQQHLQLKRRSVVTTTWGEWRRRHPQTTVLDIDTGYYRDYHEGVAYGEYRATDELMFAVPFDDHRLANKAEVLALLADADGGAVAIATAFLSAHPVYEVELGARKVVILTDASGANRVYEAGNHHFTQWDGDRSLRDQSGGRWQLTEESLDSAGGKPLARVPAHRAYWFGWHAAFPDTRLVGG